jgi:hypothetical protein
MVVIMVGWLTRKVKQPLLTAVCRDALFIDWVAAFDPGRGSAVDVDHVPEPERLKVRGGSQAALSAVADRQHLPIARNLGNPLLQLAKWDQLGTGNVTSVELPGLSDVEQEWRRVRTEPLAQLRDRDRGDGCHSPMVWVRRQPLGARLRHHSASKLTA